MCNKRTISLRMCCQHRTALKGTPIEAESERVMELTSRAAVMDEFSAIRFPTNDRAVAVTLAAARSSRRVLNAFADVFLNPAQRPIQKQAAHRVRSSIPNDGLRTPTEAAARLQISAKQLRAFVRSGELRYVNVGRGSKKPRIRFTDADLTEFIAARTRRNNPPCPSTSRRTHRTTNMTSSGEVIGFTARRNARAAEKPKR